jgi:hypothetical protein
MTNAIRVQCDSALLPPVCATSEQFQRSAERAGRVIYPSTGRGGVGGQDHRCEPSLQCRTSLDMTDIGKLVSEAI